MKKSNFCLITVGLLLVFFAVASVSAASITVKSPIGGETWQRGTTHTVTWSYTDFPAGAPVKLILLKADADVGTIITSTSIGAGGTGSFTWPIGSSATLPTGNNFKVKVQSINQPTVFGKSPAVFTLTPAGTTTPPAGGTHFGQWQKIDASQQYGYYYTTYPAQTDGFVKFICESSKEKLISGSIGGGAFTNVLAIDYSPLRPSSNSAVAPFAIASFIMPVQKGQHWFVEFYGGCDKYFDLEWLPIE